MVAEGVTKSYGDRTIVRDFSTRILRGDRVGIVGPNGAGKTTLLNLLTGKLAPDAGEVKLGTNLAQVTLDQRRETPGPGADAVQTLTGGAGDTVTVGGQNAPCRRLHEGLPVRRRSRRTRRSACCPAASAAG